MRSCEYIIQLREESKKEEIKNWNMSFYNSRRHHLKKRKNFANAHCVKITFENQKNGEKMETITHILWREADSLSKPVKIWAKIVNKVVSYDGMGPNT